MTLEKIKNAEFWLEGILHQYDESYFDWAKLFHSKLHRLDGPAITYADGTKAWYINGMLFYYDCREQIIQDYKEVICIISYIKGKHAA